MGASREARSKNLSVLSVLCGEFLLRQPNSARIAAEFILMVFRISEHLSAIRNRGGM